MDDALVDCTLLEERLSSAEEALVSMSDKNEALVGAPSMLELIVDEELAVTGNVDVLSLSSLEEVAVSAADEVISSPVVVTTNVVLIDADSCDSERVSEALLVGDNKVVEAPSEVVCVIDSELVVEDVEVSVLLPKDEIESGIVENSERSSVVELDFIVTVVCFVNTEEVESVVVGSSLSVCLPSALIVMLVPVLLVTLLLLVFEVTEIVLLTDCGALVDAREGLLDAELVSVEDVRGLELVKLEL